MAGSGALPRSRSQTTIPPGQNVDYRKFVVDTHSAPAPDHRPHRTVMPGWDNTAQRQDHALTFIHATPEVYEVWLEETAARAFRRGTIATNYAADAIPQRARTDAMRPSARAASHLGSMGTNMRCTSRAA